MSKLNLQPLLLTPKQLTPQQRNNFNQCKLTSTPPQLKLRQWQRNPAAAREVRVTTARGPSSAHSRGVTRATSRGHISRLISEFIPVRIDLALFLKKINLTTMLTAEIFTRNMRRANFWQSSNNFHLHFRWEAVSVPCEGLWPSVFKVWWAVPSQAGPHRREEIRMQILRTQVSRHLMLLSAYKLAILSSI